MTPQPHAATAAIDPAVAEFAAGAEGCATPAPGVVAMGAELVRAASKLKMPEFSVDVDGALSIDLLLPDGCRVMAELTVDGRLFASVYNPDGERVNRLRDATAAEVEAAIHLAPSCIPNTPYPPPQPSAMLHSGRP